jgi:hypothetical protein
MKTPRLILIALAACGALLVPAASTGAAMYWGATIKGDVYGQTGDAPMDQDVWNTFESHTHKKVTFVNLRQGWVSFDAAPFQALRDRGALPLVTMGLDGTTLAGVAAGTQDRQIREWAQKAKAWGYPFLIRPWWEMNGDWYPWGRDPNFVAAWRHFHDLVVAEGATNVTWAWIVNGIWSEPASDPAPYYPGDAYVDWVGMDSYNWGLNPLQPDRWETPAEVVDPTLDRLEQIAPGKPVCICEIASTEIGGNKARWIRNLLVTYLPYRPSIKAFLWFNWNVQQAGSTGRWDWPIESSFGARLSFRWPIQNSIYRSTLPTLTPLTKVPMP